MFWLPIIWLVVTIVSFVANYYLQPKAQKRGPGELQSPICEQGYPIAYVAGCAKIRGANVVWKGPTKTHGKQKDMIYDYWCRMQLALCMGPVDRLRRVWFGEDIEAGNGSAGQVHMDEKLSGSPVNIYGVKSAQSYNSSPYPVGKRGFIGDQDAHVGSVVIVGTSPASNWGWSSNAGADDTPPVGWFAVYAVTRQGATGFDDYYRWTFLPPVAGTLFLDGNFCKWNGAAWVLDSNQTSTHYKTYQVTSQEKSDSRINVSGMLRWYKGDLDQPSDDHLQKWQRNNETTPTWGGLSYVVLSSLDKSSDRGFYWGESPSIPEISFEGERIPDPLGLGNESYIVGTRAACIDGGTDECRDANPANILYEWLTSASAGIGASPADVNIQSFRDAGRILWHEGIGITMVLDTQVSFDEASKELLMVSDGVLYEDPATGKWTFRLIREPLSAATASAWGIEDTFYTRTDWLAVDEDDFDGETEFTRGAFGDCANQIKVQYMDRSEGYAQRVVDVQDIANFVSMGGELVTVQNTYNSVTSRDLAIRLAYRDLRTLGTPRAKLKDELNGRAWKLRPGDCFIVNRPALGISNMRFRVLNIRYGTVESRRVAIEAVEDVFGMPDTIYSEPGSGWVDPSTIQPVAPAAVRAWELAYDVTRDGPRVGFTALAARGDTYTTGAILWASRGAEMQRIGAISYTPTGLLSSSLAVEENTASIQLQGLIDFDDIEGGVATSGGNLLLIDDEVIAFSGVVRNDDGSVTLSGCLRGVLDTIPRAHAVSSRAWILKDPQPVFENSGTADHTELFVVQAQNSAGTLSIIGEEIHGGDTDSRELRPTVPGKFRVNGATDLPGSLVDQIVTGDVPVSWATRNRITQSPGVVAQDASDVAAEIGQLSRLRLRGALADLFPLVDATGNPISSPYTIGPTGSLPTNWATVGATRFLAPTGGLQDWAAAPLATPSTGTRYVVLDLLAGTITQQTSAPTGTYQVKLYTVSFADAGGNRVATITDNRTAWAASGEVGTVVTTDASSGSCTAAMASEAPSGLGPLRAALTAERDGLDSMEDRESGDLWWAGYGMSYGLHYGGRP